MPNDARTPAPEIVEGDDPRRAHVMWAMWEEDDEGADAHIGFWRTSDGRLVVQAMESNRDVRGRDMLRWMATHGLPVVAVEVIPQAMGFWERMMREGLIVDWEPATGHASPLERLAVPFHTKHSTSGRARA